MVGCKSSNDRICSSLLNSQGKNDTEMNEWVTEASNQKDVHKVEQEHLTGQWESYPLQVCGGGWNSSPSSPWLRNLMDFLGKNFQRFLIQASFTFYLKHTLTRNFHENGMNTVRTVTMIAINVGHSLPAFRVTTFPAIVMGSMKKTRV